MRFDAKIITLLGSPILVNQLGSRVGPVGPVSGLTVSNERSESWFSNVATKIHCGKARCCFER